MNFYFSINEKMNKMNAFFLSKLKLQKLKLRNFMTKLILRFGSINLIILKDLLIISSLIYVFTEKLMFFEKYIFSLNVSEERILFLKLRAYEYSSLSKTFV
jgi:hypothetical protein